MTEDERKKVLQAVLDACREYYLPPLTFVERLDRHLPAEPSWMRLYNPVAAVLTK